VQPPVGVGPAQSRPAQSRPAHFGTAHAGAAAGRLGGTGAGRAGAAGAGRTGPAGPRAWPAGSWLARWCLTGAPGPGPRMSGTGRAPTRWWWPVGAGGSGPGIAAPAAQVARAVRARLPDGPPPGVVGPAGAGAARAGSHRRPSRAAWPLSAVPATAGCGHGVYPGTVGIPGMLLGWLCSRPVLRLRKCSRGCTTMPRAAARCASE
jgi:hypothetical protein